MGWSTNLAWESAAHGPCAFCREWVEAGERVALTCFEREPERCHRHCVAEALDGFDVKHL